MPTAVSKYPPEFDASVIDSYASEQMSETAFEDLTRQSLRTITAKVLADSMAPNGCRLTTFEWTYPRMIHSEIMTHRKKSANSASSRAIPLAKMIERVSNNPVFILHWGRNQKGMHALEELTHEQQLCAGASWIRARNNALLEAKVLEKIGIHKQIGNRILEPWMWITVIVSATNFENLFALRCHPAAEPHFQNLAYKVRDVFDASTPKQLQYGEWHLPLFGFEGDDVIAEKDRPKVSAGRCARVSYLTHEGKRSPDEDIRLYEQLASSTPKHCSPLEHPARACDPSISCGDCGGEDEAIWGNFDPGWLQFRKMHDGENITSRV